MKGITFGANDLKLLIKCNKSLRKELEQKILDNNGQPILDNKGRPIFDKKKMKMFYDLNDYLVEMSKYNYKYITKDEEEIEAPIDVYIIV